jgi:hypothetical protein
MVNTAKLIARRDAEYAALYGFTAEDLKPGS